MKPTGKTSAPTRGTPACLVAVNASVVAIPRRAPERTPRKSISLTDNAALAAAKSIEIRVISIGFMLSIVQEEPSPLGKCFNLGGLLIPASSMPMEPAGLFSSRFPSDVCIFHFRNGKTECPKTEGI
jgi:hypothetical protein